jgi:hypothetical protein
MLTFDKMFLLAFYLLFVFTGIAYTRIPIRHAHVDLLHDHSYLPAHLQNPLNLGENTDDLMTCIYLCQDEDYCLRFYLVLQRMIL